LISLVVCYSLVFTTVFLPLGTQVIAASGTGNNPTSSSSNPLVYPSRFLEATNKVLASLLTFFQGGGGLPSVPGPDLPNLDATRAIAYSDPVAPPAIPSTEACGDCTPCPTCGPGSANHAPVVQAGGPYYGTAGTPTGVNGLASFDVDSGDGISLYAWSFGDNTSVVNGAMPSHAYQSAGNYQVSLTITDAHNATATSTTTASITAAPSTLPPSGTTQGNGAQFIAQSVPTSMTTGQSYPVSVTMRNTGTTTWTAAHLYRLGSQSPQDNVLWGTARVYLPATVAPGADVTFTFNAVAPFGGEDESPTAQFQWRMVQEGVEWFGTASQDQVVQIASNYQPPGQGALQLGQFSSLFASRIAPEHRTGRPGEDLLSGNYNWGSGMVDLAGRSGLNLNLGLSYNSLAAWTKVVPPYRPMMPPRFQQHTTWTFDADRGFPSTGFKLGFPSVQGPFNNNQTGHGSYLVLMPSGARVELRQVDWSNVYEAADSSYLQLIDGGNGSLLVRTTDGTQLAYWSINNEYRCTEVQDRNGNYISIKYDSINGTQNLGRMTSIIDTLGRTLAFNYDTNYRLQSITQLRNGQTHVWATFGYSALTIGTNFSNATPGDVLGLPATHIVSLLTQVGLDDGSRYNFDYTSWGQVYKITHHAADSTSGNPHPLSYVSYNLPLNNSAAQDDCPRFTQRQDWAENWNDNQPVTTSYQINPDGLSGQVTTAEGTSNEVRYKEFSNADYYDWRRGLVTRTEVYTPNSTTPRKTTITDWTQDNLNVAYPLNPRPSAVTISDAEGNRRRTTIEYGAFGLASDVYELGPYGANDWRTLRRTHTDYNLSDAYVNRRIIGLVAAEYLFAPDANGYSIQTLMAKTTYEYDVNAICSGFCYTLAPEAPSDPVVQHDQNYGAGYTLGRGLLAKVQRWDAADEMNANKVTTSSLVYNVYGSLIRSVDPLLHTTQIHYDDAFSNDGSGSNPAPYVTMAYPTTVTDPDGYSATAKYNYELGVVTRQQNPKGAAQTTEYDSAARVKRITNAVNAAYTRFVYPPSQTIVSKFSTIQEGQGEAYSATILDGAGRVRAVAGDFPGSVGHYSGQFTLYDLLGRASQQTNPTEMTHTWSAAGDDVAGWNSSLQTYDWKGRPLVTTNADGTTKEASYGGCGCAGGEVVTLTDEGTMDAGVFKRRQQKVYSDPLGRTIKTEVLNWQGGSVYSTVVNTYNASDQVTLVRQYQGAEGSGVYQDTVMSYDGYGRLKTKHVPEQDANTATSYDYKADDTVEKVTDARGASQTFSYNNRHLVTGIAYAAPAGIAATPNVSFTYDTVGNRTSMSEVMGSVNYVYNQLSRLTSETRQFSYPGPSGNYTLTYAYNLAGELTKLIDPTNAAIDYSYDALGRTTAVTGSSFGGVTQYATNVQYRAWGAMKAASYGNTPTTAALYNARLQPTHFEIPGVMAKDYQYNADGQLRYSANLLDNKLDRSYSYDHAGRIKEAFSGPLARGEADTNDRPYKEYSQYDAMDHLVNRAGRHWSQPLPNAGVTDSFVNNRNPNWQYDADGRLKSGSDVVSTFDAAGRATTIVSNSGGDTRTSQFDGDGRQSKLVEVLTQDDGAGPYTTTTTRYSVYSSVVGKVITELDETGQKRRSFVYNGTAVLAWQQKWASIEQVSWEYRDPSDSSFRVAAADGNTDGDRAAEMDPLGSNAGTKNPYSTQGHQHWPAEDGIHPGFADLSSPDCQEHGMPAPCTSLNYEFWGSKIASLPGFGTNWGSFTELGLREYEQHLTYTLGRNGIGNRGPEGGWGDDPQNPDRRLTTDETSALRSGIADLLSDPNCLPFINELLGKAAEQNKGNAPFSTDPLKLFDEINSKGGYNYSTAYGHNTVLSTLQYPNAAVLLIPPSSFGPGRWPGREQYIADTITEAGLHETLHLAGRNGQYSDQALARATLDIAAAHGWKLPSVADREKILSDRFVASFYWDDILRSKCKPSSARH
jgi:YD repeat-containing protein